MGDRSEVGKLVTFRAAAAWVGLIGYPASVALMIYGFFRAWSGDFAIGMGLAILGLVAGGLLCILVIAVINRSNDRLWEIIKNYPRALAGQRAGSLVIERQADGLDSKSAEVEAQRARHLSQNLAVLLQAERLRKATSVDQNVAGMEDPDEGAESLRAQLVLAIANVRGQIELQMRTPGSPYPGVLADDGKQIAIRELQTELAKLEEALAGLNSADA